MQWFNVVLQGVLIGGLYAMFAAGLSLIFGVMRLVNIAHGDLIVLAAYVSLMVTQGLGVDPLTSLLLVVPVMAVIGYALQRGLLNRTLGDDLLPPLLVTFGLSIIIQNGLLELFTADSRKLQAGAIEIQTVQLVQGVWVGILPLHPVYCCRCSPSLRCRCCSTGPRLAALFGPPLTTSRWRS